MPDATTVAAPPEAQIAEIMLSQVVSRLVYLAATLKLADHLEAVLKSGTPYRRDHRR